MDASRGSIRRRPEGVRAASRRWPTRCAGSHLSGIRRSWVFYPGRCAHGFFVGAPRRQCRQEARVAGLGRHERRAPEAELPMDKSKAAGCTTHLTKPIEKDTLLQALEPYLLLR